LWSDHHPFLCHYVNKQLSNKGKGEIITDTHLPQGIDQWREPEQSAENIYKGKKYRQGLT
jgi:hypothetical protein